MSNDLPAPYAAPNTDGGDFLMSPTGYAHASAVADRLAKSGMIPESFRGKPEDILIAMNLARRMGEDLFVVLSAVNFIHGRPGWSASFLIARANASGIFKGPLEFDTSGEGRTLEVTCSAVLSGSGKHVSSSMSMATAIAEGWAGRNKRYQTLPTQMLSYRSATLLIRLYAPGLAFGMRTEDENDDIYSPPQRIVVEPERVTVEPAHRDRPHRRTPLPIDPPQLADRGEPTATEAPAEPVTAPESTVMDSVLATATDAEEGARKALHHESWKANGGAGQRAFFAKVKDLGLSRTLVCDLAETRGTRQRPSAMDAGRRAKFLGWLATPEGRAVYDDFVAECAERDARSEGDPESVSADGGVE